MKFIDPHIHCVSRTTDDYRFMQRCGVVGVSEPAFWAGFDRSSAASFGDYFRHLTDIEPKRAAMYGIDHYCWLCINAKEAENVELSREVIKLIPPLLNHRRIKPERVLIDHCEEHTIRMARDAGFWAGLTIYPVSKVTPVRGAYLLEQFGPSMICVNSASDWGDSHPSNMIDTCLEYRRRGHSEEEAGEIFFHNPSRFFGQSGKWKINR